LSFFVDGEREADSTAGADHNFIDEFGEQSSWDAERLVACSSLT
jgi:hypothetical protein